MVQLSPVPVYGAKKNTSTIWRELFHRQFRPNDKRSLSHMEIRNNYRVW